MKISEQQIQYICEKVIRSLKDKELAIFKGSDQAIIKRMVAAFKRNLEEEANLDKEVKKLLLQHQQEIDSGSMNYNKLFLMMKKKLAKDKGIIL